MSNPSSYVERGLRGWARLVVRRPGAVLASLVILTALAAAMASQLTINSNQLDLISQDLQEVKDVKRVIDMVGGAGHLMLALRSEDVDTMKKVADDLGARLQADDENVRSVTWKLPVEFIQKNMVLFIETEDLREGKRRINEYLRDQIRRANPFFIEIVETEPKELDLDDLVAKYGSVGNRSIRDDYNLSNDRLMVMMLIKPMWDSNDLGKTEVYIEKLRADLEAYSRDNPHGVELVEDYERVGDDETVAYGFSGSYKLSLDDSLAIKNSLEPVTLLALLLIGVITAVFVRKVGPILLIMSGVVMGTVITLGFTWATVGTLNMITSMLAGLLMGFGVDYGLHLVFRIRLELAAGKAYALAIEDAVVAAGRPAMVSALVTAGAFFVLLVSEFRGFSQFGLLAGFGCFISALTLYAWIPSVLVLLGRKDPARPGRIIGTASNAQAVDTGRRIPRPGRLLALCLLVVGVVSLFALPLTGEDPPKGKLSLGERLEHGVQFDYNTRALIPDDQYSVKLNDEVGERFGISSDPVAVYTRDLEETKALWDELSPLDPEKYSTIDQVVSVFTFVPPPDKAAANAAILAEWQAELADIDIEALPPELQEDAGTFMDILAARPFDVHGVPEQYREQFRHLETTAPENHGWLTFIYPTVDLWDGKNMLQFADQTSVITTEDGREFRAAGQPTLYAKLARIVLKDGKLTVVLAALWILLVSFLDFRDWKLVLASVLPLGLGLLMMMGLMAIIGAKLNFMNVVMLPLLLGFGISHGFYLLHRFLEGTSPLGALKSVGAAVAASTLTTMAGFGALLAASHNGIKSMGLVAVLGLATTLLVSFSVLAAVLQVIANRRDGVR